jgi:hypothetical protein
MLQIKDYRRDVNDVGLAGPPTENSWFRHWSLAEEPGRAVRSPAETEPKRQGAAGGGA